MSPGMMSMIQACTLLSLHLYWRQWQIRVRDSSVTNAGGGARPRQVGLGLGLRGHRVLGGDLLELFDDGREQLGLVHRLHHLALIVEDAAALTTGDSDVCGGALSGPVDDAAHH